MHAKVTNVVVGGDLHCTFKLKELTYKLRNCIYNPSRYSGMIWRHKSIISTCFLFHTGKILCMGNKSFYDAKKDLRKYARMLCRNGYDIQLDKIKLITKSAVSTMKGRLNLEEISKYMCCSYEAEIFNAVLIKKYGTHFTCFPSGKVIMTGVKNMGRIYEILGELELFTL